MQSDTRSSRSDDAVIRVYDQSGKVIETHEHKGDFEGMVNSGGAKSTRSRAHVAIENKWYALKGRVVELKVEADGDLHIALHDATGDKPGVVVCEVPAKPQWCEIRTTVFSWTPTRFPFHTGAAKKLTFGQSPIITVIEKAFWDVGHAPKDQSNRRKYMPDYAVWEIHLVMKLEVVQ